MASQEKLARGGAHASEQSLTSAFCVFPQSCCNCRDWMPKEGNIKAVHFPRGQHTLWHMDLWLCSPTVLWEKHSRCYSTVHLHRKQSRRVTWLATGHRYGKKWQCWGLNPKATAPYHWSTGNEILMTISLGMYFRVTDKNIQGDKGAVREIADLIKHLLGL